MLTADDWIHTLNLEKHPEGGYYREYYRSRESFPQAVLPTRYRGQRNIATAIYFLLKDPDRSHFHQLKSDELWHFHMGSPIQIHCFMPDNTYQTMILGPEPDQNQKLHAIIPAGTRFGAHLIEPEHFILMGCTVAPGFDFADFSLCEQKELLKEFPEHGEIIELLTKA